MPMTLTAFWIFRSVLIARIIAIAVARPGGENCDERKSDMHKSWHRIFGSIGHSALQVVSSAALVISLGDVTSGQQPGVFRNSPMYNSPSQNFRSAPPSGRFLRQPMYPSPYGMQQSPGQVFSDGSVYSMPGNQWCPPVPSQPYIQELPSGQALPPGSNVPQQGTSPQPQQNAPGQATTPGQPGQTPANPAAPQTQAPSQPSQNQPNSAPGSANSSPRVAQSEASSAARGTDTPPGMIGDFFGGLAGQKSLIPLIYGPGGMLSPEDLSVIVPRPGDMVGRIKFGENNSPIPRDRFIMDYTLYDRVDLNLPPIQVHRYTPGVEKTFCDGFASVDVRWPFATTLDSDIVGQVVTPSPNVNVATSLTDTDSAEFGNLSMTLKFLLHRDRHWAISSGVQGTLPTADDVRVFENGITPGTSHVELLRIDNKSYHVMPFLAAQFQSPDRFFMQCFVQADIDTTGSPVLLYGSDQVSRPKNTPFLYLDTSLGYWLYRDQPTYMKSRHGRTIDTFSSAPPMKLTGFAPRVELHYNKALDSRHEIAIPISAASSDYLLGANVKSIDILNLTLGASCYFGANKELALAWGTPITGGTGSEFNSEFRVMFNYFLGPPGRTNAHHVARH